jgi:hypothetical protein
MCILIATVSEKNTTFNNLFSVFIKGVRVLFLYVYCRFDRMWRRGTHSNSRGAASAFEPRLNFAIAATETKRAFQKHSPNAAFRGWLTLHLSLEVEKVYL